MILAVWVSSSLMELGLLVVSASSDAVSEKLDRRTRAPIRPDNAQNNDTLALMHDLHDTKALCDVYVDRQMKKLKETVTTATRDSAIWHVDTVRRYVTGCYGTLQLHLVRCMCFYIRNRRCKEDIIQDCSVDADFTLCGCVMSYRMHLC